MFVYTGFIGMRHGKRGFGALSRFFHIMILSVFWLAAFVLPVQADTVVEDIRYGLNAGKTRVVVDLGRKSDFRAFTLANPARLVIDIEKSDWRVPRSQPVRRGDVLKSYRSGELDDGLTRIVFDLKQMAVIDSAFALPREGTARDRVVVDMRPASENLFTARLEKIFGNKNLKGTLTAPPVPPSAMAAARNETVKAAEPVPLPPRKPNTMTVSPYAKDRKHVVVIDPGHGGADPGAVSGQIYEKHITLAVSKELRRQLEETGRYRVVMTRDHDKHVRLNERLNIARREKADLFISIHADKIDRVNVRGASVYTLSRQASDAETARLAERENNAGVVAGVDLASESDDVAGILLDLAMREKMNESSLLARFLETAFRRKNVKLLPNSHRSAGFAVLKAPDVPSVLIEIGFLSNPAEAKMLGSAEFQRRISGAIVEGVDAYFRKIIALQKI